MFFVFAKLESLFTSAIHIKLAREAALWQSDGETEDMTDQEWCCGTFAAMMALHVTEISCRSWLRVFC
jgi:hypothetical protein